MEPLQFTYTCCKTPMKYLDDVSWSAATIKASIENHQAFFEVFSRDDGKFKRDLLRQDPALITFLAEFHTIVLIKLDQARQALENVKDSANQFLRVGSHIDRVLDLQRDLTLFFVILAGSLDAAEAEIEIITRPAQFKIWDCQHTKIRQLLPLFEPMHVPAEVDQWLRKGTLTSFRNFLVHRFSLRVLSRSDAGMLLFSEFVDPSTKTRTLKVLNEPSHTEVDSRLGKVIVDKLRRTGTLDKEFKPDQVYPRYVTSPEMPVILLPDERELDKSPEEIKKFQDRDVRGFCDMNYEMASRLLGSVNAFLIRRWNENSQEPPPSQVSSAR